MIFLRKVLCQTLVGKPLPSGKFNYLPLIHRTRSIEYELGQSAAIRSVWTNFAYDSFANPIATRTITVPGATVITTNQDLTNHYHTLTQTTFSNDESDWQIGLPTETKVTHHVPGKPDQVRTTQMQYNHLGNLVETIVEPDLPDYKLVISYEYDGLGNVIETKVDTGEPTELRVSTTLYDDDGMYVIGKSNALGHTITISPDSKCEAAASTTDANGLTTTMTYDHFCRVIRVDYPDGTWKTTTFGTSPLRTIHSAKNQPEMTNYYDSLGRIIRTESEGFDGRDVITERLHNHKGQITHESAPYYQGDQVYWTKYYYDAVGRLQRSVARDGGTTTLDYNGLTTITTNPLGQTHTSTVDIVGRLQTVLDAQGNAITYDYDSVGNLLKTTDPQGNNVIMGYDHVGRKISMNDPDMGNWTYEYDVLGQLIKQTDAKNQVITTEYDLLGRLTKRTVQPDTPGEQLSTWTYDSADNGVGLLSQTNGPNSYQRQHIYDDLSRPKYTHEWVDGLKMTSYQRYNSNGKLLETRYPGRTTVGYPGQLDRIQFSYNSRGYLKKVYKRVWDSGTGTGTNVDLWVAEAMDAKGNVTQERYGNGVSVSRQYHPTRDFMWYVDTTLPNNCNLDQGSCTNGIRTVQDLAYWYDTIGNLVGRRDDLRGAGENFYYDDLNRLIRTTTTPPPHLGSPYTVEYDYDVLGNLTYRSDVGIMNYNGSRPHAVTSILENDSTNVTENVYNPYGQYDYDANGNLITNGERMVGWTAFNKPASMITNINGDQRGVNYTYGSDFQRITKLTLDGKYTRYYGGGAMEHITEEDQTFWKYYIPVGATTLEIKYEQSGPIADGNFTEVERQYLFKDHIGSTDVIVDNDGNIVERLSFNPWGERRDADWTEADGEITSSTNRGFTGHEMDDEIGLINMNARIYDPVIGRFLSPDALIPSPTDLQSYNRYSYVRNNPLSFTDPTGFAREDQIDYTRYDCGECRDGRVRRPDTSHIIRFPGNSGHFNTKTGKFYGQKTTFHGGNGRGANYITNSAVELTDPGQIAAVAVHLQVGSEIVQNYGGLSRGNSKETRNKYRGLAAAELSANGQTPLYQDYLNRAYAADQIYKALKRKARRRYGALIATTAITAGFGKAFGAALGATGGGVATGAFSGALSGDPKAALIGAATGGAFGRYGINPGEYSGIDKAIATVKAISLHAAVGCASSAAGGGSCSKGAAAQVTSKLITVGFGNQHSTPKFVLTVAAGGLINGSDGAITATLGYLFNHLGHSQDPEGTYGPVDTSGCDATCTMEAGLMMVPGGAAVKALSFWQKWKFFGPKGGRLFGWRDRATRKENLYRLDYHNNPHNKKLHNHYRDNPPKDGILP